jgi:hypothetical protein
MWSPSRRRRESVRPIVPIVHNYILTHPNSAQLAPQTFLTQLSRTALAMCEAHR